MKSLDVCAVPTRKQYGRHPTDCSAANSARSQTCPPMLQLPSDADIPAPAAVTQLRGPVQSCAKHRARDKKSPDIPSANLTAPSPALTVSKESSPPPGSQWQPQIPRLAPLSRYQTTQPANESAP